ncbi:MAG: hypothetical protein MUD14_25210 [Hydrococcus sp. Prado102]|jgi:hypothetical protein|nr:hypothetical protein [Hydrococcus sp. Prado102]
MKIADLNFLDSIAEKAGLIVGGTAVDEQLGSLFKELKSLTGETVGVLNTAFNVSANGTNKATTDTQVNSSGNTQGQVKFIYSTTTSAFASTPGS